MEAVKKSSGACVILAGAGTGKTYSIVEKVKYLIKNKIYPPERIVCITFSNEAANNLKSRIRGVLDIRDKEPVIKTFHAFSADLLRKYGDKIGLNCEFGILTPDDAKVMLHRNLKVTPNYCHRYMHSIGTAKDLGIKIEDLKNYLEDKKRKFDGVDLDKRLENLRFELQTLYLGNDRSKKRELVREISELSFIVDLGKFVNYWGAYEKIKEKNKYQDYSDLNRNALKLLEKNPEISGDYDYVIVDEFQDTNKVQLDFLEKLVNHKNITIVGDMNQSIYRFRGAYKENYSQFKKNFDVSEGEIFNLDKSYRSPNKVLRVAHKLILNNYENKEECFEVKNFGNREGGNVEVYELNNAKEEARKIVDLIKKEIENGKDVNDICVMFRSHQQGRVIKRALEFAEIPFCSVSKNPLLKSKQIKIVIDYLTILDKLKRKSKGGEQVWWDLIYNMDFIEEDLIKIGRYLKENSDAENISAVLLYSLDKLPLSTSGRLSSRILIDKIKLMIPLIDKEVSEIIRDVFKISGLLNGEKTKEEKEMMLNLNKFHELAKEHSVLYGPDLSGFLNYLSVVNTLGIEINSSAIEEKGVRLMTNHSTKGLEFDTIIVSNLAQKRFPIEKFGRSSFIPLELYPELSGLDISGEELEDYIKKFEEKNNLLEERRLCYVSFTRAKNKLILTYAKEYGNKKYYPSQFLNEINYKENKDVSFFKDSDEKYVEPNVEIKKASDFSSVLGARNFDEALIRVIKNSEPREKVILDLKDKSFSPSALLLFDDCQKAYEYRYVYNMPEPETISWDAKRLGSFVHAVLEKGVAGNFSNLKEFMDYARDLHSKEDWGSVDFSEAEHLIKIFYERNKNKYSKNSRTEQKLKIVIDGIKFSGFADRIDFNSNGLEIIDYKTGKSYVKPKSRNWQLGYYAIAASQYGSVKKITLDMLRHEKPLEFFVDSKGNATAVDALGRMHFNVNEVKEELVSTARKIIEAYEKGFKPCSEDKNCKFCNEYVYGN